MVESPPRGGAGHETWRDELERAARAPRSAVTVVRRAGVLRLQVGSWDFESELRYDPPIRCRFDLACQALRLAVEVDGGRWASGGGRHGGDRDYQKLRRAALLGWSVLRFLQTDVKPEHAIHMTQRVLAARGWQRGHT